MTRRHGYALLAALAAVVVLISAGIFALTGLTGGDSQSPTDNGAHRAAAKQKRPGGTGMRPATSARWTGTWSASPVSGEPGTAQGLPGKSIRNVVHTSIGGTGARITLSNLFGTSPLQISHASLAVAAAAGAPAAEPGTMRALTFRGKTSVVIPVGRSVASDGVSIKIPYDGDLLITVFSPTPSGPVTYHPNSHQTSYTALGEHTGDTTGAAYLTRTNKWRYLTGVDVLNDDTNGSLVLFGDSITDGLGSTQDTNRRWPDVLSDRLRSEPGAPHYGILNQGISGNRLLNDNRGPSGLSRFDADAVRQPGAKTVVVLLGINDIGGKPGADAESVVAGLRELVRQGHARQQRVLGGTLLPFGGHKSWTPEREMVRQEVNAEIRAGRVFDGILDFDAAVRDPHAPERMLPAYDAGDHLHPSDEGYRRMGQWVDLRVLARGAGVGASGV
ncbi:SGNH/GDSL hydrolase family protein [Streptomyces sp. NPDC051561]|uniref:SGNH/GDSL hydrolase family protein n=1 Tax=Streptomyces sp. NPDC051561 TaxID=3365658 RepID=UPI00379F0CD4